jgi:hypothetical protein
VIRRIAISYSTRYCELNENVFIYEGHPEHRQNLPSLWKASPLREIVSTPSAKKKSKEKSVS